MPAPMPPKHPGAYSCGTLLDMAAFLTVSATDIFETRVEHRRSNGRAD